MRQRPFRVISAYDDTRCTSYSTYEKAKDAIIKLMADEGQPLNHVNYDYQDKGWTMFVSIYNAAYEIVDMNIRDRLNAE